ncbi:dolichol phosphate-mannose biosynthesis regulatory [Hyaloraphidium curvatum]|nr:dolichol phosphate-mannose biosynthesis regulatory [Hyaloraphidium curvatum]
MALEDRIAGAGLIAVGFAVFAYYTLWALVLPFVDSDHPARAYFPPPEWAIRVPVALLLVGLTGVSSFVALVMLRSKRRSKPKVT